MKVTKYRVAWMVLGQERHQDYDTLAEAESNKADIEGYEGVWCKAVEAVEVRVHVVRFDDEGVTLEVECSTREQAERIAEREFFATPQYGARNITIDSKPFEPKPCGSPPRPELSGAAVSHKGIRSHRLRESPEEARFAEAWGRMQVPGRVLEWILTPNQSKGYPDPTSERDEAVAATVIQWLGSPVGQGFLQDLGYERQSAAREAKP